MAGEKGKAKKRKPIERANKAQSERFIKAAKDLGVDETGQAFELAMDAPLPRNPKRRERVPYTIDDILGDPLLTVVDRHDEMGSFAIKIGKLQTVVFIELGRFRIDKTTKFHVSHAIHTPKQAGPYRTSKPFDDDWEYALHRAVTGLTSYYNEAVKAGHVPSESWLVKN